jgi:hypothetical protein
MLWVSGCGGGIERSNDPAGRRGGAGQAAGVVLDVVVGLGGTRDQSQRVGLALGEVLDVLLSEVGVAQQGRVGHGAYRGIGGGGGGGGPWWSVDQPAAPDCHSWDGGAGIPRPG